MTGSPQNLTGILIHGDGEGSMQAAVQVNSDTGGNAFLYGLYINNGGGGGIMWTGICVKATGINASIGLDFNNGSYSAAEITFPSFEVGPTPSNIANRLYLLGGNPTVAPSMQAAGTDTNIGISIFGKGTGIISLGQYVSFGAVTADGGTPAVTGYIAATDYLGNPIKIATIT